MAVGRTLNVAETRIPSLDGARAISIGLVIVAHLDLVRYVPGLWRLDTGNLGVRVFFVISGFIITNLLITELRRTGSVSLIAFYRRRFFRILPAYYTLLATVLLLSAYGSGAGWSKVWPAAIFVTDYVNVPLIVGHTWSLSVEEQFYLLWPSMFLLGLRKSFVACIAILFLAPLFRILADNGLWPTSPRYAFECVADALAVGCLLAITRDRLWNHSIYKKFVSSPLSLLPLLVATLLIALEQDQGALYDAVGLSALNIGIAIALDRYMRLPGTVVGRFLNLAPMIWLGLLSYSLYLWQQVFAWSPFPTYLKALFILGSATLSYYVVERPFQRLRRWIELRGAAAAAKQPSTV
jgi:peptidoglycan/LPS O-acetylase OafA/YrhL